MTAEIHIQNLSKEYPGGKVALSGVNLTIGKGTFFALLGPNGAGKSTLVKILTTLIEADSGEFRIGEPDVFNDRSNVMKYIGIASQENELDPAGTTCDHLVFQGRLFGMSRSEATKRANEMIDIFDLGPERNKKTGQLSGGNKRRLHCALSLVHRPRVLFLDEPTVGMDPVARASFWDVISRMNREEKVTVFLTSQYLDEVDRHAGEMALLIDGRVNFSGTVEGFKKMVNPGMRMTLDDSYLTYIRSFSSIQTQLI